MPQRIYAVTPKNGNGTTRLVKATTQATARSHVAKDTLSVQVASQDQLVESVAAGVKVEQAGEEI